MVLVLQICGGESGLLRISNEVFRLVRIELLEKGESLATCQARGLSGQVTGVSELCLCLLEPMGKVSCLLHKCIDRMAAAECLSFRSVDK